MLCVGRPRPRTPPETPNRRFREPLKIAAIAMHCGLAVPFAILFFIPGYFPPQAFLDS
jgi:hypothetical protein